MVADQDFRRGHSVKYLSIKNWDRFQHYKDRRPPWIKLHAELLDNYEFLCLQDASKVHLMLLWVLASKMDNRIPYDLQFIAQKIGATTAIDIEELVLQGFIDVSQDDSKPLAGRKQSAMPETEAERETESDERIDVVLAAYHELHPRRKIVGPKPRTVVKRALKDFSAPELIEAVRGNAGDPWHREQGKHELSYVLRDAEKISDFRERYARQLSTPQVLGLAKEDRRTRLLAQRGIV